MCGIFGYIGTEDPTEVCLQGLKKLEYRGYDSAGVGIIDKKLSVCKEVGEIANLEQNLPTMKGTMGIGHTRWATHGKVSKENAHPHFSGNKKIALIHNGIIENFQSLREELHQKGHIFLSQNDSEIIAHVIEEEYTDTLENAVQNELKKIKGSYALVVVI